MDTLYFALRLLAELVPLFLLVSTLVYLLVETLTPDRISRWLGGGAAYSTVPIATMLGAIVPFCSCSTVPIVNGMRLAGVATAPLVAFLIASPIVSPVAMALLWNAIGAEYAVLFAAAALGISSLGGIGVAWWYGDREFVPVKAAERAREEGCSCAGGRPVIPVASNPVTARVDVGALNAAAAISLPFVATASASTASFAARLGRAFVRSWTDLKKFALPLLLAVVVGALIHGYVPEEVMVKMAGPGTWWAVPGATALGIPVYASIVVLLPLASALLAKGVGIGAVTAFLMGANGFSLPEGILLSRILPGSLLWRIVVIFTAGVLAIGYLFRLIAG